MKFIKVLYLICVFSVPAGSVLAADRITDVQVDGNSRIGTDAILNKITQNPGAEFDAKGAAQDIRSLFKMGYFDRIHVKKERDAQGVKLTFVLKELPVVHEIRITGNDNYDSEDMLADMEIKPYEVASHQKIVRSLEKLRQKYKEKGYYLAQLSYKLPALETENEVDLVIEVKEHEQIRIRKIIFIGNKAFSEDELKSVLNSKEGNAMSWMTQAGRYHELMFEQDVHMLRLWYLDHGHVKVQISNPQTLISPDQRWVTLSIQIDEGEKYDFGEISYGGDMLFTQEELAKGAGTKTGELFRSSVLQKEIDRLSDLYGDLGYAFTNVIPQTNIHEDPRRVDIRFDFEKGNLMHINRIFFTGNTKTHDKVMRREMRIYEGDLYGSTKVKTSKRNVQRTGYFAKVVFKEKVDPNDPSVMDMEIEVEEKPTGTLMVGAGYSSQDGFVAQGRVAQENFLGTGQQIQFYAQIAGSRSRFSLSWDEPYMFDYNVRFGTSLYFMDRTVFSNIGLSFSELKAGGSVSIGRPLGDDMLVSLSYKLERVWLQDIFNEDIIRKRDNEGFLSSGTLAYTFDTRNDRIRPTEGFFAQASSEFAAVGGTLNYMKLLGNVRWYIPLFAGLVYRNNMTGGAVFPVFGRPIPVSERFVLGGTYDIRGYRPGSVGPMVCAEATRRDDNGNLVFDAGQVNPFFCSGTGPDGLKLIPFNVGGRYQLIWNTELEYPLIPKMGISVVTFVDIGTSFDKFPKGGTILATDLNNTHLPSPLFRVSVGWGFRWWSPIGPLRFEFGYPLIRPLGEPTVDAQFAIAPTF